MGLSDFERELAQEKEKEPRKRRDRSRSRDRDREHRRSKDGRKDDSKHHRRSRHTNNEQESSRHRHKRSRRDRDDDDTRRDDRHKRHDHHKSERHKERRSRSPAKAETEDDKDLGSSADDWVEKESNTAPPGENNLDEELEAARDKGLQRDDWMQAPSSVSIDYVQRQRKEENKPKTVQATKADYELKLHEKELNHHLQDLQRDEEGNIQLADESAQHEVDYEFGDGGSQWRMTKLKGVYRQAQESGRSIEEVAEERFGDLRSFDDAREEEIELDRRKMYGKDYVGKIKPSGELFQERKMKMGIRRQSHPESEVQQPHIRQGEVLPEPTTNLRTISFVQLT